jgi:hypothetical protein
MSVADVNFHVPLIRLNPWYPGQFGVEGAWTDTGLRAHCTGTIFYVDPNYPGVSDQRDGTDPTAPLNTIEAAIARCESFRGDIIAVMHNSAWQYSPQTPYGNTIQESVTIDKHGIRIVGLANGTLGVPWQPAANDGYCITNNAIDVTIEGFLFQSGDVTGGCGILTQWDGAATYGENMTVRHCSFLDDLDIALHFDYTWYCHVHHCNFWEVDEYAFYSDSGGGAPTQDPPDYIEINNNVFHNIVGGAAIWLPGLTGGYIHDNQLYHEDAAGAVLATNEGFVTNDGTVTGDENMVVRNAFSCQNTAVANGDYGDLNNGSVGDCWSHSYCMNGLAYAVP